MNRPTPWAQIEEDERYQYLSPQERSEMFGSWTKQATDYGNWSGGLLDENLRNQFSTFVSSKGQELTTAAKPPEEPSLGKVISDQFLSGTRAWDQGLTAVSAASGLTDLDTAAQKIAESERANQNVAQTEDMKKFQEAEGFFDSAKQIITNPLDVALPLFAQSIGSQITPMIAGGAAGAAAGAVTGPGAAVTGLVGAGVGSGVGDAVVSFPDFIREKGYDLTDPEQVKAALNDPDVVAEAAKKSAARGLVVGATSAFGGAVAGKVTAAGVSAAAGKTLGQRALTIGGATTADVAIQTGLEGAGEAGAQLASTGKLSPKDIAAEMFVQTPGQLAEIAIGTAARIKDTAPQTAAALEQKGILKAQEAAGNAEVLSSVDVVPDDASIEQQAEELDTEEEPATQVDGEALTATKPQAVEAAPVQQLGQAQQVTPGTEITLDSRIEALTQKKRDAERNALGIIGYKDDGTEILQNVTFTEQDEAVLDGLLEQKDNKAAPATAQLAIIPATPVADAPARPTEAPVNVLPTGTDAVLPPQRMGKQDFTNNLNVEPEVDETADVFAGVQQQQQPLPPVSPAPAPVTPLSPAAPAPASSVPGVTNTPPTAALPGNQQPPAPAPQPLVAPAPSPDAQTYEDSLVQEAKNAGTKVTGRRSLDIKKDIQGKGWYPKTNVNKAIAEIRDRVRQRLEAEPTPDQVNTTAPAPDPVAASLPEDANTLIAESRRLGSVPSSTTINARYGEQGSVQPLPVEQRQAVRREAARQVASDYGITYDENLEFTKDFDGIDNVPIRITETGTEPVFVNNPDVTARQLDQGLIPTVPQGLRDSVVQGIEFEPETGRVTSAVSRGVTVQLPGQLERGVRAQRPGTAVERSLVSDTETKKMAAQSRKLNKGDLDLYKEIEAQLTSMAPVSPQIGERFSSAELASKALSIWVNERTKDKIRSAADRKNYSARQVWMFANEKAFDRIKNLPKQVSLDAPITETGTLTRGDTVAAQDRMADSATAKDAADREAANAEDDAIDEGVAADEPTNVSGSIGGASTGMNYDQAYNIINSPRLTQGISKKAVAKLKAEAQELLDLAPQDVIDDLEANDVDYWTFTAEDFRNVDTGNTNQIVSSSPKQKTPYISEQTSWMKSVARALGARNVSSFTPSQFTRLAQYYAGKYRPFFDQGNTTLPESAVVESLPEVRAIFEAPEGAASDYRAAVDRLRAQFPGAKITYSTGHNASAWYNPRFRNQIFLNPLLLEQELNGLSAAEAQPFLKAVLFEEYIHMVERQTLPQEIIMAIAQRLPDNVRQRVIDSYVGAADQFTDPAQRQEILDSLDDLSVGSEYLRMLVQRMRNGQTTEDLAPENLPQNLFEQVMRFIRALVNRLKARLEVARDPVLAHTIKALEAGMRKMEVQSELRGLSEQDLALISDQPGASKYVFARPRGVRAKTAAPSLDYREEALKVQLGRSYWITPEGRIIDVVAEDQDGTNATHGRYIRNWVKARVGQFFPGEAEKEVGRRIQSRAQELMAQDPALREELDNDALIAAYVDEVSITEAMDLPQPDYDEFVRDAINKLGPSDMAYNEAAIEVGWARIAVPSKFSPDAPLQIQVKKDVLGSGANQTIKQIQGQRVTSVVEEGALANRAVNRTDLGRMMDLLRKLPGQSDWQGGIVSARPGLRIRGKRVGDKVEYKPGGLFSSGLFTTTQRDIIQKGPQKIAKATANAEFLLKEFRRAVKKSYGKNPVPTNLINQALGSTENRLTDQQVTDLKKIRDKDAREVQRLQYMSDNRNQARLDRDTALAQLPAPVAKVVGSFGAKIDELSLEMRNGGYIADDLIPVFDENLGLFIHRSYAIFESPQWKDNMVRAGEITDTIREIQDPVERQKAISDLPKTTREHVRVRVAFERFAVERSIAEYATEIRRKAKQNNQTLSRQQAIALAKADTDTISRKASDLVLKYLSVADQDAYSFFTSGRSIPGRRNLDIIKVRGQVPKELREFWGEVKDAETNFTQTVSKMAAFMAHHDVATELLNNGVAEGFIWKAGVSKEPNARPEWVPLIPKGTASPDSISPLYGAYGPKELQQALLKMIEPRTTAGFYRFMSFMTASAMAMKTIGYVPRSFVRNFLGNPLIALGRGYFDLSDPVSMGKALADGFRLFRLNAGLGGNTAYQALRERALELGVIGDNIRGTLIKKLYEESTEGEKINELLKRSEFDSALEKIGVRTGQAVYKGASKLADIYQGVDDIWKMYAWEMEQKRQKAAHPTWDARQIEEAAAQNVRNLMPTYSLSPEITQRIRRIPVFAPFFTWTSEMIRTTGNNLVLGKQEISEGLRTNNKAMVANGSARLGGFLTAVTILPAFAMAMKAAMGYDDDDEEAVRTSLRDWQKNNQLIFLGSKDQGKVSFIDLSYLDPNQIFAEPMIAATRAFKAGDNPFTAWAKETLRPVYSEQLFIGAMADIMRNSTADGLPIVNEQDTMANQLYGKIAHVTEAIGPGTLVTTIPNMIRGAKGEVSRSSKVYSLTDEVYSAAFGQKISEVDAQTSLRQAAGRFMSSNAEATRLLNDTLLSRGTVDVADIPAAYENANRAKRDLFEKLRDNYNAALKLGVPRNQAIMVMRSVKVSQDLVAQVINDRYIDYAPVKQALNEVITRPNGKQRLTVLRDYLLQKRKQDRTQNEG